MDRKSIGVQSILIKLIYDKHNFPEIAQLDLFFQVMLSDSMICCISLEFQRTIKESTLQPVAGIKKSSFMNFLTQCFCSCHRQIDPKCNL